MGVASDKRIKRILRKVITLLLVGEAILGMNAYCGETTIKNSPHNLWSKEKAWQWYRNVSPVRGCNYLPRTAVNMTEMWQADTFDTKTIDEELGWAEKAGYNSVRIYLQYLVWNDDPEGLKKRVDEFLTIADKHGISSMLILFCDCAFSGKEPYLGKQDEPIPGVHNSGWVPSPGLKRVTDKSVWPDLEKYVKDIVGSFGKDKRVLIWDLYNEPGNSRMGEKSLPLAEAAFGWAGATNPSQPLTTGAWADFQSRMSKRLMELSDIVSFHGYDRVEGIKSKLKICQEYGRPVICTEWLRRGVGNTFAAILPIFAEHNTGWYNWGLVAGRTQTYMPWGSKKGDPMPKIWQHDMFHPDGRPYDAKEIELIRRFKFTDSSPKGVLRTARGANGCYLFSYFIGNGEDGLHLAYSFDGLNWKALNDNKSLLTPRVGGKLMRDPCIIQGPEGAFHMVWTTSWSQKAIGYAYSRDLVHWSEQKYIPVMEQEPKARNCWAPEVFYDDRNKQFLIYWSTTIPGRFPETDKSGDNGLNHRIYYTTTRDFETFTPTKLFYDPGFNTIDATIVKDEARYILFIKDETRHPPKKNIRIAVSTQAEGPYGPASEPITGNYWAEGPSAIKIGDTWFVYFDKYRKGRYGAVISGDLKNWEDISDKVHFPEGTRHGTIFRVSKAILTKLLQSD